MSTPEHPARRPPRVEDTPAAAAGARVPTPRYHDETITLYTGDARDTVAALAARSVDCVVTSPPYFGTRDYAVAGQYGLEPSVEEYLAVLAAVFDELRRVLRPEGSCWVNLGDTYASAGATGRNDYHQARLLNPGSAAGAVTECPRTRHRAVTGLARKNLLGLPWRLAFALQSRGWILRNAIVWHKPNAVPESVQDRLSRRYEMLFLFATQPRYYFDLDPIRRPPPRTRAGRVRPQPAGPDERATGKYANPDPPSGRAFGAAVAPGGGHRARHPGGANPGDVWTIANRPLRFAHYAAFPLEVPRRAIAAGSPPGGVVLDPFSGAGTTVLAARQLGRRGIGIDLNPAYHDITLHRIAEAGTP